MQWSTHTPAKQRSYRLLGGTLAVVFLPALLLAWKAERVPEPWRNSIIAAAVVEAVFAVWLLVRYECQRVIVGRGTLLQYVVAAAVLRFAWFDSSVPVEQGRVALALLMFGVILSMREIKNHRGHVRRAKFLLKQLCARDEWPTFTDMHRVPEVQALRDVLHENAAPALPFLAHTDPRVQAAILTALSFQPTWRKGQPEIVLHYAYASDEPAVRAAAATALACVRKTRHINVLLTFMHDPYTIVRQAAAMAVLWDAQHRWTHIRAQVRAALANPNAAKDGPLPCAGTLPAIALQDLLLWSGEAGPVGKRSTSTVIQHCKKVITEDASPEALDNVLLLVSRSDVPAAIRVEVAYQLSIAEAFAPEVAAKLLDPTQPTMLRLMAAGSLLSQREDKRAIEVLREAARQPNREIALAAAGIIQKYLGVDVGLPVGGELPALNTRQAAEVTRRVLEWAVRDVVPSSFDGMKEGVGSALSDEF